MFPYSDPSSTGLLAQHGGLGFYRSFVDANYQRSGNRLDSGFATMDAFSEVADTLITRAAVEWQAYPVAKQNSSDEDIDDQRGRLQEEYVEWRVEKDGGRVTRVTFCTFFHEFFESLAAASTDGVIAGIKSLNAAADPTVEEIYGTTDADRLNTPQKRFDEYRRQIGRGDNPWNNGEKGIMQLIQPANTMGALFRLMEDCAIPDPSTPVENICGGGFCVPDRNSDPKVCSTAQGAVRQEKAVTLADPVGIEIARLDGDWELDGDPVDINEGDDIWNVSHGGHFGLLSVPEELTVDGDEIESGAQVARFLFVRARALLTDDSNLPFAARRGNEPPQRA